MDRTTHAIRAAAAGLIVATGIFGNADAQDVRIVRTAQAMPAHESMREGTPAAGSLPAALPPSTSASSMPKMPRAAAPAAPVPSAAPAQLGLPDFEQIALHRNPTLRQAAAQVDATLSRSFQAGLYPNPTIGYIQDQIGTLGEVTPSRSGVNTRGPRTPGELVGGFVQQEIVTGGKLRLSRAKFAEEANAARWQSEAQTLRVLNGVRVRFFEVLAAQRMVQVHRQLVRINDDAVRTTDQLVNVGQANEPDLLQAKVDARRSRVALRNAENHYRRSWQELTSVAGAPELQPTPLDEKPLDARAAPLDFDGTLNNLLEHSPEIQAALAEIRRSQIMVRRERVQPIPNVTLQAVVGSNFEFNGLTTAGVQASIPLPIFNRNQGTVREAEADLMRDHAEYERVVLSLRNRLAEVAARYNDAQESVDDFRGETLPMAQRAYEIQLSNFRQRRAAWPQVLVAQRTLTELNREYVDTLLDLRRAEVAVNGMLLIDGLTPPESPTPQGHIESVPQPR
jgi:cobalt-zinc-cadmium efflux system outer membrane protein